MGRSRSCRCPPSRRPCPAGGHGDAGAGHPRRQRPPAQRRRSRRAWRRPSSAWAASGAPSGCSGRPPGVYTTAVGYAGGFTPEPHLRGGVLAAAPATPRPCWSCSTRRRSRYEQLLRVFWEGHDPTQGMRQGNDVGTQYRSAIYSSDDDAAGSRRGVRGDASSSSSSEAGYGDDHHRDPPTPAVLLRRGLPPAVPAQGAQRLLRPRRHRRQLPGGRGQRRLKTV